MRKNISTEENEILIKLSEVKQKLTDAYTEFNTTLEPELIEASVFEINALQARYAYLFRRAKEIGSENVEAFRFPNSRMS